MGSARSIEARRVRPAQLARELGVSRQSIHELIDRGILAKDADGLIDVELARVALANRIRPSAKSAQTLAPTAPPPAPVTTTADTSAEQATSYHVAKTIRESAEAQMAKLKLAQMKGELVESADVERATFTLARQIRDALLAVPARLAPQLAAESDITACKRLIAAEMRGIAAGLADQPEREPD